MSNRFTVIILAIFGLATVLVITTLSKTSIPVFTPTELVQRKTELPKVRVGGRVSSSPISYTTEPLKLEFTINDLPGSESASSTVPVVYLGIKPDMFDHGRDVIIDGEFKNGVIYAATLLTQCPSKYEPPTSTSN